MVPVSRISPLVNEGRNLEPLIQGAWVSRAAPLRPRRRRDGCRNRRGCCGRARESCIRSEIAVVQTNSSISSSGSIAKSGSRNTTRGYFGKSGPKDLTSSDKDVRTPVFSVFPARRKAKSKFTLRLSKTLESQRITGIRRGLQCK